MINVLFVTFASTNFDGATYSLMDLIRSVRSEINPLVLVRSKGWVYDYFTENGVECIVCDFEENLIGSPSKWHQYLRFPLNYLRKRCSYDKRNARCIKEIKAILGNRDIQIVHTNNTVLSIGLEIARAIGAKHVWHLRGFMDLDFGWKPFYGWYRYKREIERSDAVIGITQAVLDHFVSESRDNVYAIFDAVRHRNETTLSFPKEKYFLFCAGLLSHQKGCDFAIKAFALSGMASNGYRLRIIGEANPDYAKQLHSLIKKLGIDSAVDFLGLVKNVEEHMSKAAAFLMCSENEGMGRVSVEAMFSGCLIYGRNSGGTKEFVLDGKTGYLFDTVEECAALISEKKADEETEIIINAQKFVQSNFATEDYGQKIMEIYYHIL